MIFLTVGTQLAFPRLTEAMDAYAARSGEEVIAQIGAEAAPRAHLDLRKSMTPAEYDAAFQRARIVVAHAGIGTILSAKRHGRPLVVVPRRHDLGEHRNDHQMATARAFEPLRGLYVAWDIADLPGLLARDDLDSAGIEPGPMHAPLVAGLAEFIQAPRRR